MKKKTLHITNGSSLTSYLKELNYKGDFLTWHEMLCEGPTETKIATNSFIAKRKEFLNTFYDIEIDEDKFTDELHKIDSANSYTEIVLWFEYDLFCHINMVAVISLLKEKRISTPLSLVCSGRIQNEEALKGLSELNPEQLDSHYKNRINLTKSDIEIALNVWEIYCGKDHNLLKPYITKKSSFQYLGCCLKAHLKRYPDSRSGLNTIEHNILSLIQTHKIKSKHHLLGYALNYQGYYGFGDIQLQRIIDQLSLFYSLEDGYLQLNRKGHEVLLNNRNFALEINNDMVYGKLNRLDYQFNIQENKLIKTVINAY